MIVSSCYLSSVKSFPHGKTENQMDYGCFFSCLKESYMTQAKKDGETAPDNPVNIHSNMQFYVHSRKTVSCLDKTAHLKMLCQFSHLTPCFQDHLILFLHISKTTYCILLGEKRI